MREDEMLKVIFLSRCASLAREVSLIDSEQLKKLIQDSDKLESPLYMINGADETSARLKAGLAILVFAAEQLSKIMPSEEQLHSESEAILSDACGINQEDAAKLVDKMGDVIKQYLEGDIK